MYLVGLIQAMGVGSPLSRLFKSATSQAINPVAQKIRHRSNDEQGNDSGGNPFVFWRAHPLLFICSDPIRTT
jgi:hypothetical protein